MQVPELTDDAVVELAREGGVAFIPVLSGQRTITLSSLNEAQRQRVVSILEQAIPRGQPHGQTSSPGSGDQRYFRIQIFWTRHNEAQYTDIIVLVPGRKRPNRWLNSGRKAKAACVIKPRQGRTPRVFRDQAVAVLAK